MSPRYNGPRTPSMQRREKAPQRTPTPGYFLGRCVAVTSLSSNPARLARQQLCLQSWSDNGLQVIAVNTAEEIADWRLPIGDLSWRACEDVSTEYDRPTQRIATLIDVGRCTGLPFLLLNSDIEICGDPSVIDAALDQPDKLTIGIRHNHKAGRLRDAATIERYGLDCFLMTPELASTIPQDMPFAIGKPVWDYWLPYHFRQHGVQFYWIRTPFFFHESHWLGWSQAEWDRGSQWMLEYYGLNMNTGGADYRASL